MPDFGQDKASILKTLGITGPNAVGDTDTQTLTSKTLTTPIITSISNSGTITVPTGTDTLVGKATTDVMTNKTLTTPTLTTPLLNGEKFADISKTGNYTLLTTDTLIRADASAGAFTLTLPAASGNTGLRYSIIRTDVGNSTNLLTIDANASELINGSLTMVLYPAESTILECDGTGWQCVYQPGSQLLGYYYNKGATANQRYVAGLALNNLALLTATTGPTSGQLYAMPFIVTKTTKFDTISCQVTTLGSGSSVRMSIYADTGNCYPGVLIFDSGAISSATTGVKDSTITASLQVFNPGLYWLTYENSTTVPLIICLPGSGYIPLFPGTLGTAIPGYAYTVAHTFGASPNPFTAGATIRTAVSAVGSPIPAVGLRPV